MVPLQPEDQTHFAFTWKGQQYTFTRLSQGFKHSPTLAHYALARELEKIPLDKEVKIYQYIDNVLMGSVLGLVRTGLIFTGLQEGAQPGGLTQPQPGQTEPGIPYHVPSCWVPVGGAAWWELTRGLGGHSSSSVRENGSVLLVCFVYSPFLYRCCSCSLCLLFC